MCAFGVCINFVVVFVSTFSVLASFVGNGCIYYLYVLVACIGYAIWHCVLV